ncbi:MAG: ABC transporter permease [Myxococcota bacterium]
MKTLVIAQRELRAFFVSPMAYAILVAWLLWCGQNFAMLSEFYSSQASVGGSDNPLSTFFGGTLLFYVPLLVFVPVITMRLIAGERASGSFEALVTAPIAEHHIVFGKFLAAFAFYLCLWVPTLLYVWITSRFGDVDAGTVAASYLGVAVVGALFIAVGVLMSALSPNQVVAATLTFLALGMIFAAGIMQYTVTDETFRAVFAYVSVWSHMQDFARGIVDSRPLVFHGTLTAFLLMCAVRVLQWRRVAA